MAILPPVGEKHKKMLACRLYKGGPMILMAWGASMVLLMVPSGCLTCLTLTMPAGVGKVPSALARAWST